MRLKSLFKHLTMGAVFLPVLMLVGIFSDLSCTTSTEGTSSIKVSYRERAKREVINPSRFREVKLEEAVEKQVNLTYSYLDDPAWEKNEGQEKDEGVLYYTRFRWGYIAVTANEVLYYFYDSNPGEHPSSWFIYILKESYNVTSFQIEPRDEVTDGVMYSYFLDSDPDKWIRSVKRYRSLLLRGVDPGVDVELRINEGRLEKIIHAKNPAALTKFRIVYEKQTGVLLGDGSLKVGKIYGSEGIYFAPPVLTGNITGNVTYIRISDERWGLKVNLPADAKPARIDVKLMLADKMAFRGEAFPDVSFALSGNSVYIAVTENVPTFIREPGLEGYFELVRERLYILRFDRDLKLHSKVCVMENGISKEEGGGWYTISHLGIKYSSGHGIYVYGEVYGDSSIPAHTGHSKHVGGGRDIFLIHLNEDLSQIKGATFLGGGKDEKLKDVYISSRGVYVVGTSRSRRLPAREVWYSDTRQGRLIFAVLLSFDLSRVKSGIRFSPTYYNRIVGTYLGSAGLYICIQGHYEGSSLILSQVFGRMSTNGRVKNETVVKDMVYLVLISQDLKKITSGMIIAFYKGGDFVKSCRFEEVEGGSLYILGQVERRGGSRYKFLPFVKGNVHSVPRSTYNSFVIKVNPSLSQVHKVVWIDKDTRLSSMGLLLKDERLYFAGVKEIEPQESLSYKGYFVIMFSDFGFGKIKGGMLKKCFIGPLKDFNTDDKVYVFLVQTPGLYSDLKVGIAGFYKSAALYGFWKLFPLAGLYSLYDFDFWGGKEGRELKIYTIAATRPSEFRYFKKGIYGMRYMWGEQAVLLKFSLSE